jgi:hypothetical protein
MVPALDAGNWITLLLALLAAATAWGMTRQEVADLKRRITTAEGTRDEVIRLQEQVKNLEKNFDGSIREIRDILREFSRPQRRKSEAAE